jgi:O-antigen ligase
VNVLNTILDMLLSKNSLLLSRLFFIQSIFSGSSLTYNENQVRLDYYQNAINTIVNRPFFGLWLDAFHNKISGHSFILDTFAKHGIIGFVAIILLFYYTYKYFYKPLKHYPVYKYMMFSYFVNVVIAILNPFDSFFLITFIVPIIGNSIIRQHY